MCIRNKPNKRHKNYQTDLAKYPDIYLQTKHYILDKNDLLMFLKLDFKRLIQHWGVLNWISQTRGPSRWTTIWFGVQLWTNHMQVAFLKSEPEHADSLLAVAFTRSSFASVKTNRQRKIIFCTKLFKTNGSTITKYFGSRKNIYRQILSDNLVVVGQCRLTIY